MAEIEDYAMETINKLKYIDSYLARNSNQALARREQFVEQVKSAVQSKIHSDSIDAPISSWIIRWKAKLYPARFRFHLSPVGILALIILATAILFTGAGITYAASQVSGPLDALYPLKLAGEDVRLHLVKNTMYKFDLLLEFVDRRVDEAINLEQAGEQIPEVVIIRLQEQVDNLFQLAASVDTPELIKALNRLQLHVNLNIKRISLAAQRHSNDTVSTYDRLQVLFATHLDLIQSGLRNPEGFRQQIHHGDVFPTRSPRSSTMTPDVSNGPVKSFGVPQCENCTPMPGNTQADSTKGTFEVKSMPENRQSQESGSSSTPVCEQCEPQPTREQQRPGGTTRPESGGNQGETHGTNHP